MEIKNRKSLNTNFENKANPSYSTSEQTYLMINKHGITVEVPENIWLDHQKRPQVGYTYLGLKGQEKPVPAAEVAKANAEAEATQEYGPIGGDKPIRTLKKW